MTNRNDATPIELEREVRLLSRGRSQNTGTITLTASATTTTKQDSNCTANSVILFEPTTANAAAAIATTYVSSKTQGSFVVTHANNAQTDRTFKYVVIGR